MIPGPPRGARPSSAVVRPPVSGPLGRAAAGAVEGDRRRPVPGWPGRRSCSPAGWPGATRRPALALLALLLIGGCAADDPRAPAATLDGPGAAAGPAVPAPDDGVARPGAAGPGPAAPRMATPGSRAAALGHAGHGGPQGPPILAPGAWTVRGRWDEPTLTWRCDPAGGPFAAAVLERAAEDAAAAWNASGVVQLAPAAEGRPADVLVSWHGAGDFPDCKPFGQDRSVAHTGALVRPVAIHLDSTRPWSQVEDGSGEWLTGALMHEFGHVLGLDHASDPSTLMHADTHAPAPTTADLAGLHSLYGGGRALAGDLAVRDGDGRTLLVLRGLVPPGTAWRPLDVDGDGASELLVWSTRELGLGALLVLHFDAGPEGLPRLVRTSGPLLGALPAEGRHRLVGEGSARWLVTRFPDGSTRVLTFAAEPLLAPATADQAARALAAEELGPPSPWADLDGDGHAEQLAPLPAARD